MPALFSFGSSAWLFSFVARVAYSRLMPAVGCALFYSFQCRRRYASWPAWPTESGRLALVGGGPPLTCFHILSCGLISSAYIMRTNQCYSRQLRTDAGRGSCGFWTAVPADTGMPTSRCDTIAGGDLPRTKHARVERGSQATALLSIRSRTDIRPVNPVHGFMESPASFV